MCVFFFFNDTATTEIYTLSLHDALPISGGVRGRAHLPGRGTLLENDRGPWGDGLLHGAHGHSLADQGRRRRCEWPDRKSTRLNSSHQIISYAVFCLKKKHHHP